MWSPLTDGPHADENTAKVILCVDAGQASSDFSDGATV